MLICVLFPCFPPAEADRVHVVPMSPLVPREHLHYLLPLADRRGHQHEGVQQVVEVQVLLRPTLKGKEVDLARGGGGLTLNALERSD